MHRNIGDKTKGSRHVSVGSIIARILLWFMLLLFVAGIAAGVWFYLNYGKELLLCRSNAESIAAGSVREDFANSQTSICYYSDGSVMQILSGVRNVYYLSYDSIPSYAVNAVCAVEDRKFFSHKGYDIYAIARAAKAYIRNDGEIRQGGSTITQQLARMIYLSNEKTIERKATEIFLAAELERKYSKKDILEFYLNNIYCANGYYGIQAASKGYFGVTVGDLSLSQIAFICGISNSPSAYDPRVNFEKTLERRNSVLKQMYETGCISEEEYTDALAEEIVLCETESENNNYEETYTYRCAVQALMKAEGFVIRYSFNDAEDEELYNSLYYEEYYRILRNLYAKGYRIYTSINPIKQEALQKAIDSELASFTELSDNGIYKLQASGVCIDNDTGFVVAIVGGRYQESVGYTLNRAYQSPRQPGSSIKPLIVYTPAFENGYYPDTTVVDEKFEGGPRNSGDVYSGEIDIRYAVQVSKNTVAWKLLQELGVDRGLSYLQKMNFGSIVDNDYYPAAALGGLTYGATAVEMTSAYAAIENDGIFRTPTCIIRITDSKGNEIINNTGSLTGGTGTVESKRIYDKNAARMMTDVLTTVMLQGTGRKANLEGITCAGKTGTTNDQKDGWFVGYTGYYTTGIWVGCDMPETIDDLMGSTYPGQIWHTYMQEIHEGLEDRAFEPYKDDRPLQEETEEDSYPYGYIDTDGDGIPDGYPEGWTDNDGDGIPDGYPEGWTDNDGDGIPDGYPEGWTDSDGEGIPDGNSEEPEKNSPGDENDEGLSDTEWVKPGEGVEWVEPGTGVVWVDPRAEQIEAPEESEEAPESDNTGESEEVSESDNTGESEGITE